MAKIDPFSPEVGKIQKTEVLLPCSIMDLPKPTIHQIMSYLSAKEAGRMVVLSSKFAFVYYSFPFIELCYNSSGSFDSFLRYVNDIYLARRASNVALEKFLFHACVKVESSYDSQGLDRAIHYALDNNVKNLDIILEGYIFSELRYFAPSQLLSAKSLKVLSLSGFNFFENCATLTCPLLEELTIKDCPLLVLNVLCPKLVSFSLHQPESTVCYIHIFECKLLQHMLLKRVLVSKEWISHVFSICSRLKSLNLSDCKIPKRIDVIADNLESIEYTQRAYQLCKIDLVGSRFLKSLTLVNAEGITNEWLQTQVSRLHFLQTLCLLGCQNISKLKITNHNLETLELVNCNALEEIEIIAGNLHSLKYKGTIDRLQSTVFDSSRLNAEINLPMYSDQRSLRFLSSLGHFQQVKLIGKAQGFIVPDSLKETLVSPMHDLKKLIVDVCSLTSNNMRDLVDTFLWLAPRPDVLIIHCGSSQQTIKFEYTKPLLIKEDNHGCCRHKLIKCWRHHLTKLTMKNFTLPKLLHQYFTAETYTLGRQIVILNEH